MYILHAIDQCIQYVSQHLLSRPLQNDCPVRNVADGTFFNILYLKRFILKFLFFALYEAAMYLEGKS